MKAKILSVSGNEWNISAEVEIYSDTDELLFKGVRGFVLTTSNTNDVLPYLKQSIANIAVQAQQEKSAVLKKEVEKLVGQEIRL